MKCVTPKSVKISNFLRLFVKTSFFCLLNVQLLNIPAKAGEISMDSYIVTNSFLSDVGLEVLRIPDEYGHGVIAANIETRCHTEETLRGFKFRKFDSNTWILEDDYSDNTLFEDFLINFTGKEKNQDESFQIIFKLKNQTAANHCEVLVFL
jgi:hypothetical protein